jgi:hypothetical protein
MNRRLAWHILRKDARRWWWMIALTLVLLGRLTWLDAGRHYVVTGSEEGWLYLLLPLAWSFLIVLTVMDDPVLAEAPFWMTLPCGWQPVIAAKSIFLAVFIHLPYFIGCCAIVQARGFSAFDCLPELLYKQMALAALTLPSLAIASVVRNPAHFMMIVIALATAVAAPSILPDRSVSQDVRIALLMLVIVTAGAVIAFRQYRLRLTPQAQRIGAVALAVAVVIWWLPRESFYGLWTGVSSTPPESLSVHYAPAKGAPRQPLFAYAYGGLIGIGIPIDVRGYRGQVELDQASVVLTDSRGQSYKAAVHRNLTDRGPLAAEICCGVHPQWQTIFIEPGLLQRLDDGAVTLRGAAFAQYHRNSNTAWLPLQHDQFVPNLGRCSSDIQWGDGNPNNAKLHVECESPHRLPSVDVTVAHPGKNREWHDGATGQDAFVNYLRGSWLSPIERRDTYYSATTEELFSRQGGKWSIPVDDLSSLQLAITPGIPEGSRIVRYEIPNIRLRDFETRR